MIRVPRTKQAVGSVGKLVKHPVTRRVRRRIGDVVLLDVNLHSGTQLRMGALETNAFQNFAPGKSRPVRVLPAERRQSHPTLIRDFDRFKLQ
jgi:hypothetical protein